jgi:hypothetical protein
MITLNFQCFLLLGMESPVLNALMTCLDDEEEGSIIILLVLLIVRVVI